jgi:hypothetical protein
MIVFVHVSSMNTNRVGGGVKIKLSIELLLPLFQDVWPVLLGCGEHLFFE